MKILKCNDKEEVNMVLFMILAIMLVVLTVFTVAVISVTGAVGVVLFGDIIVCIWLILWFIKRIIRKKK